MIKLTTLEQMDAATPLFAQMCTLHLSVGAVLTGSVRGEIWVDDPAHPCVGLAQTPEGHYLAGDAGATQTFAALKTLIPTYAYLIAEPEAWTAVLDQVWDNPFVRPHARRTYRLHTLQLPAWRGRLSAGYDLVRVDRDFLERTTLRDHDEISSRTAEWPSIEDFLARGFGFCILHGDAIVSRCIVDCVVDNRCEIGVGTDSHYRRLGLGSTVVAAAVEHCLHRGLADVGWHCLRSNAGSIAVAEKVGFEQTADYFAYSAVLPAENAGDLDVAECIDWAQHCERASERILWCAFYAAGAWALAGETKRALCNVQRLIDGGWQGRPEWLETSWMFASIRQAPAFDKMVATLRGAQAQ